MGYERKLEIFKSLKSLKRITERSTISRPPKLLGATIHNRRMGWKKHRVIPWNKVLNTDEVKQASLLVERFKAGSFKSKYTAKNIDDKEDCLLSWEDTTQREAVRDLFCSLLYLQNIELHKCITTQNGS